MSGVFGVASKNDCIQSLFYGTDYHSHLGTQYGGIAVLGDAFARQIHNIAQSQFKSKFYEDYRRMKGRKGIGVISDSDEQPIYLNSRFGPFCIVTNGYVENWEELSEDLLAKGHSFSEVGHPRVNQTELVAKLITMGDSITDGIEKMFMAVQGSCSLLILCREGIYAARDRMGFTPLALGQKDGAIAVSSESSAFHNTDFQLVKFMDPGEIILISEDGIADKKKGRESRQVCTFLWIYTGFPASTYEGVNVETAREKSGRLLASKDRDIDVDIVSGVPDSGTAHAIGYAMESGKPFRRPLVKYTPGYGRSYTPPSQEQRDLVAKMKLVPVKEIIEGNRIVVCEDSIVRGTQLKNFTVKKLWDCGACEIHVRPACPPLMFPCRYNVSTRSISELAARKAIRSLEGEDIQDVTPYLDPNSSKHKAMVDWIARDLGVTTLRYQTVDDMVKAIGLPKDKLCLYCWQGKGSLCPAKAQKGSKKVSLKKGKKKKS